MAIMVRAQTTESYADRLRRVTAHIHANLNAPPSVTELAEIACLSSFHFHRIYRAMIGETVAETIVRQRLHRAATALARSKRPLSDIARQAGYNSLAAFCRAFRAAYNQSPSQFRATAHKRGEKQMDVSVQERPDLKLITTSHKGPAHEIGEAFDRLVAWAGPRGLLTEKTLGVAVYLDDMATTPPADQRSLAGLTVDNDVAGDGTVAPYDLRGGRHAVILYKGPYSNIGKAYDALYDWLAQSDEEPADAPTFEVNLNNPRSTPPHELLTEVCLPLK